ncbi:MAG TPA: SUMF1/EgtB/PvdO family nonheme iron enzyme [Dehalococcoidia bacterium]
MQAIERPALYTPVVTVPAPNTVLIPDGPFTMGDDNARPDERPAHRVTLSAFRLAVLPVTNEDYARYLEATATEPPRFWADAAFSGPRQPVVGVSWPEAVAYCGWLSEALGSKYRLPTEAEWEKAALGGTDGLRFPWGDACWDGSDGNFPMAATWEVGGAPPNGYGIVDIGFNIHEWCADWYAAGYYAVSPERDPQGPPAGERKASRGGAWRHMIKIARCSARSSIPPNFRYNDYGFRLAQNA